MRSALWILLLSLTACTGSARQESGAYDPALVELYHSLDYFTLRERLGEATAGESAEIRVLRAAELNAFNRIAASNEVLDTVLHEDRVPQAVLYEARRIRCRNLLRLHRYAEAETGFAELLQNPPEAVKDIHLDELRNMRRLTAALKDVPPQRMVSRAASTLPVDDGLIDVTIQGTPCRYAVDTGANFSFLIESEADRLGLEVLPAGLEVGSSTDLQVTADLAVADRVELGGFILENVVFLVFPDEVFTFPDAVIRGIIGFPVVEALGELRFRKDSHIEVPAQVPEYDVHNLALDELTPLIRVGYGDDHLVFRFDTGASRTELYEPFYRRYRDRVEAEGTLDTLRTGGAGGIRDLPGYTLTDVTLRVGDRTVTFPRLHVHTRVLTKNPERNDLYGNLGLNVMDHFDEYILNFRSMSLLLR